MRPTDSWMLALVGGFAIVVVAAAPVAPQVKVPGDFTFEGGKDSPGPDAYGAVDEAVSMLGLARAEVERGSELDELLVRVQRELFVVGAELATAPEHPSGGHARSLGGSSRRA